MAARSDAEADLVGLRARQANDAAVQLFVDPRGQARGPRRVPARRTLGDGPTRRPSSALHQAVLRDRRLRAAARPAAASAGRGGRAGAMLGERRGGRVELAVPQRGSNRAADGAGRPQRSRDAGPRAGALAGRRRARRWRALEELADALGLAAPPRASSATTSATSRAPTRSAAWSSSRTAGRAPASTAASGSGRSRAPTTSPATRRCCGAASAAPCGARRAAPRSCAGACRTWSSSTAARAR